MIVATTLARGTCDIRMLLSLCAFGTLDAAEDFYDEVYPGDSLYPRAVTIASVLLSEGARQISAPPGLINL